MADRDRLLRSLSAFLDELEDPIRAEDASYYDGDVVEWRQCQACFSEGKRACRTLYLDRVDGESDHWTCESSRRCILKYRAVLTKLDRLVKAAKPLERGYFSGVYHEIWSLREECKNDLDKRVHEARSKSKNDSDWILLSIIKRMPKVFPLRMR